MLYTSSVVLNYNTRSHASFFFCSGAGGSGVALHNKSGTEHKKHKKRTQEAQEEQKKLQFEFPLVPFVPLVFRSLNRMIIFHVYSVHTRLIRWFRSKAMVWVTRLNC